MRPVRAAPTRSNASCDLPAPDGPRISTARAPTKTAEAWMVAALIRSSPRKRGPTSGLNFRLRRNARETVTSSQRRQADDEARAEHRRLAIGSRRRGAVLSPDVAAMRLDDLFGDRQTEAGILAE